MKRATVVSGAGRYADPWHAFRETSELLAETLRDEGLAARLTEDVDAALADPDDVDLLVVNIGAPQHSDAEADRAVRCGLLGHVAAGRPLLVQHVSVTSLPAVPEWAAVVGGAWLEGTTMHPPFGLAHIQVGVEQHPIVHGVEDFDLEDERYTDLRVAPDVEPLLLHEHEGARHPVLWARRYGAARIVYDSLGHDARSYASLEHRQVLGRSVRWLLGTLDDHVGT